MENFILFPHKTSMGRSIFDCKHVINRTAMSEHEETKKKVLLIFAEKQTKHRKKYFLDVVYA